MPKIIRYTYHEDGSRPIDGQVFVFGSNLSGIHGAGAALAAKKYYGAVPGIGEGFRGQSYAIPTKCTSLTTLPAGTILTHVKRFVAFAKRRKDLNFFVTRVGCGLAGHQDSTIAAMFNGAPYNCSFAEEWQDFLERGLR